MHECMLTQARSFLCTAFLRNKFSGGFEHFKKLKTFCLEIKFFKARTLLTSDPKRI